MLLYLLTFMMLINHNLFYFNVFERLKKHHVIILLYSFQVNDLYIYKHVCITVYRTNY